MIRNWKFKRSAPGQILIISVVFLAAIIILSSTLFSRVTAYLKFGSNSVMREQAVNMAEAAVDKALWQLNQTGGSYAGETNTAIGTSGTFTVVVTDKSPGIKTITATGFTPNAATPKEKQVITVDTSIGTQAIAFRYAVQVGTGGISMDQATIFGTAYSNKTGVSIQGQSQTFITGDSYTVGTISSPNPIVSGVKRQNQPASQMPTLDYNQWKNAATAGGTTTCSPTCSISSATIGPQKYVGNISFSSGTPVTMLGPVYVTGNVSLYQSAKLILDESFGSTGTVLITDGTVSIKDNALILPTSANPKGYILVATTSTSNSGISILNQGVSAIFYALDGGIEIHNNTKVTALVANQLLMADNGSLTYDSGLASASFSAGPGGSWAIRKGTYHFK